MKKKSLLLLSIFFLLLQNIFAQDSAINGTVSLKQCVDIALQNNAEVYNSEVQMQTSKINVDLAKGNMLPFISGNINHAFSQGRAIDPFTNGYVDQNVRSANYGLNG